MMAEATRLTYLDKMYLYEDTSEVTAVTQSEDGTSRIILDQTLFYPQGGGQPSDTGTMTREKTTFTVEKVKFIDGIVEHYGTFSNGCFEVGDTVKLSVDESNRSKNAKIHTAGHLIDTVVWDLGYSDLTPTKGYHFPNGPYVEYQGTVPEKDRENLKQDLEKELNNRIAEGFDVRRISAQGDELNDLCSFVPDYLPKDKPIWVATVWGDKGLPCGGTHVSNISDIGHVRIRKIKCKKGNTKIGYEVN